MVLPRGFSEHAFSFLSYSSFVSGHFIDLSPARVHFELNNFQGGAINYTHYSECQLKTETLQKINCRHFMVKAWKVRRPFSISRQIVLTFMLSLFFLIFSLFFVPVLFCFTVTSFADYDAKSRSNKERLVQLSLIIQSGPSTCMMPFIICFICAFALPKVWKESLRAIFHNNKISNVCPRTNLMKQYVGFNLARERFYCQLVKCNINVFDALWRRGVVNSQTWLENATVRKTFSASTQLCFSF